MAAILLGATAWSTIILIQQKKAWEAYAKKKNLQFTPNKFFEPCSIEGRIDEVNLSFFTATQENPEARKSRQLTVLEFNDPNPYVDGMACGSSEMRNFIAALTALSTHNTKDLKWENGHLIVSRNKKAVTTFLTEDRAKIITGLLKFPKSDVLILFDKEEGVYRFETSNPLSDLEKIESTVEKLISRIQKLRATPEEAAAFAAMKEDEPPPPPPAETEVSEAPKAEEKSKTEQEVTDTSATENKAKQDDKA